VYAGIAMFGASRWGRGASLILAAAMLAVLPLPGAYVPDRALHSSNWKGHLGHGVVGKLVAGGQNVRIAPISGPYLKLSKTRTRDVLQYGVPADPAAVITRLALSWIVSAVAGSGHRRTDVALLRVRAPPMAV
jgi:hypothetical protein